MTSLPVLHGQHASRKGATNDDRTTARTTGEAQQAPDSGTAPISVDQEIFRHMSKRNDVVDAEPYGEIGHRIHVIGDSCSGKSTLGAKLASALGVPLVELDALRRPRWVGLNATEPEEFERLIAQETCSDERDRLTCFGPLRVRLFGWLKRFPG